MISLGENMARFERRRYEFQSNISKFTHIVFVKIIVPVDPRYPEEGREKHKYLMFPRLLNYRKVLI